MKRGIDVSRWNVIKDYDALKRSGVEFAIVKVNNAGMLQTRDFMNIWQDLKQQESRQRMAIIIAMPIQKKKQIELQIAL